MTHVAVILAAGAGRRMGAPKALAPWGSRPLALAHAEAALAAGFGDVRVVVRADVRDALPEAPRGARWCVSREDDALGPAGSLVAAAREGLGAGLVAVSPVDLDPAAWGCAPNLVAAVTGPLRAARPVREGRGGHPVVLRADALEGYARGEATPLRDVLRALGDDVAAVEVGLAEVLGDLDTPEAMEAARGGRVRA